MLARDRLTAQSDAMRPASSARKLRHNGPDVTPQNHGHERRVRRRTTLGVVDLLPSQPWGSPCGVTLGREMRMSPR